MVRNWRLKIGIFHGASKNAGDFLIYESGKKLLEELFGDGHTLLEQWRGEAIHGHYDIIILLGGPLITRTVHPQIRNVIDYMVDKDLPVVCMGLGVSGKDLETYDDYFQDEESINFWKKAYASSGLFSVRDVNTKRALERYGIHASMTGCPALFNPQKRPGGYLGGRKVDNIAVTIPNIIKVTPNNARMFLTTLSFLRYVANAFDGKRVTVFFNHGKGSFNRLTALECKLLGLESKDVSRRSIRDSKIENFDLHVGTRLHTHINFLASNKASYLLSVDARTASFLDTIKTPCANFDRGGSKMLIMDAKKALEGRDFEAFSNIPEEISILKWEMDKFLKDLKSFCDSYHEKNSFR
jgi:hypothetical protein